MDGLSDVVLENGGHVFLLESSVLVPRPFELLAYLWEISLRVADQQTRLATASIAYNHELL